MYLLVSCRYKKKKIQANPGSPLECATAKGQNNISADEKHGKMMLDSAGETGYADSTDVLNILSHLTGTKTCTMIDTVI